MCDHDDELVEYEGQSEGAAVKCKKCGSVESMSLVALADGFGERIHKALGV